MSWKPNMILKRLYHDSNYQHLNESIEYMIELYPNLLEEHDKFAENALSVSATFGLLDIMQVLIEKKCDVNEVNRNNSSLLHLASANNQVDIVQYLLSSNADINIPDILGMTPLHVAFARNHYTVVVILLKSDADCNKMDKNGNNSLFHFLMTFRNIPHLKETYLNILRQLIYDKKVNIHEKNKFGNNAFYYFAQRYSELPLFDFFFDENININNKNKNGNSLLHYACQVNNLKLTSILLKLGADYTVINKCGETPLSVAIANNSECCVNALINCHANINKPDGNGVTPLMLASVKNYLNLVKILQSHNVNGNLVSNCGATALMYSCNTMNFTVVEELLAYDVKTDMTDKYGNNAMQISCMDNYYIYKDSSCKYIYDASDKMSILHDDEENHLLHVNDHLIQFFTAFSKDNFTSTSGTTRDYNNFSSIPVYLFNLMNHDSTGITNSLSTHGENTGAISMYDFNDSFELGFDSNVNEIIMDNATFFNSFGIPINNNFDNEVVVRFVDDGDDDGYTFNNNINDSDSDSGVDSDSDDDLNNRDKESEDTNDSDSDSEHENEPMNNDEHVSTSPGNSDDNNVSKDNTGTNVDIDIGVAIGVRFNDEEELLEYEVDPFENTPVEPLSQRDLLNQYRYLQQPDDDDDFDDVDDVLAANTLINTGTPVSPLSPRFPHQHQHQHQLQHQHQHQLDFSDEEEIEVEEVYTSQNIVCLPSNEQYSNDEFDIRSIGRLNIVDTLINHGVGVGNVNDFGHTCLHLACLFQYDILIPSIIKGFLANDLHLGLDFNFNSIIQSSQDRKKRK